MSKSESQLKSRFSLCRYLRTIASILAKMLSSILVILQLCIIASSSLGQQQPVNVETIKKYFETQGILIDDLTKSFADKYNPQVIELMEEVNKGEYTGVKEYYTNCRINKMILDSQKVVKALDPFTAEDESLMKALDLMAPNTKHLTLHELAKNDLRKFYSEQPQLCKDLLVNFRDYLEDGQIMTEDITAFLRRAYNRWIPLGRLLKLSELSKV